MGSFLSLRRLLGPVAACALWWACGDPKVADVAGDKKNSGGSSSSSSGGSSGEGAPAADNPALGSGITVTESKPGDAGRPMVTLGLGENGGCNKLTVTYDRQIPTVALVIDRSSSMYAAYGSGGNRWDVLKKTLLDPQTGLIKKNEKNLRFGLVTYTGHAKQTCPWLEKVDFAVGNFDAIAKLYSASTPPKDNGNTDKGETPTGETIVQLIAELAKVKEAGPKYIVLATDGEPDTCPGTCTGNCSVTDSPGWPRDPNCGHDRSISAVQEAFKKGIRTFVVGIGEELDKSIAVQHLQALANAGAGEPVALGAEQAGHLQNTCRLPTAAMKGDYKTAAGKSKYYKPADANALTADLTKVLDDVRSCKFTLKGTVEQKLAPMGQVLVNGARLMYGDPNGWRMNTDMELEILGDACKGFLQASNAMFDVAFPCGVFREID